MTLGDYQTHILQYLHGTPKYCKNDHGFISAKAAPEMYFGDADVRL